MPKGELDTAPLVSAILAAGSFARFSLRNKHKKDGVLHSRKGPLRPKAGHLELVPAKDGHAPYV